MRKTKEPFARKCWKTPREQKQQKSTESFARSLCSLASLAPGSNNTQKLQQQKLPKNSFMPPYTFPQKIKGTAEKQSKRMQCLAQSRAKFSKPKKTVKSRKTSQSSKKPPANPQLFIIETLANTQVQNTLMLSEFQVQASRQQEAMAGQMQLDREFAQRRQRLTQRRLERFAKPRWVSRSSR